MKRIASSVIPAVLLSVCVGQIYAFTNFSSGIADAIGRNQAEVQLAFSLGIFFLGMGAAFFGKIVERDIRKATIVGSALFLSGLIATAFGVKTQSLSTVYVGYGLMLGLGTGIIYISPVKTMMLWFPNNRAIAAAVPIISFGLGSSLSTVVHKTFISSGLGVVGQIIAMAAFYVPLMLVGIMLLKKPMNTSSADKHARFECGWGYARLLNDRFFWKSWLFMFLNISCGLCLIPLAKQMMKTDSVGYSEALIVAVIAMSGVMNGCGRFVFAFISDKLMKVRTNILILILGISIAVMTASVYPVMIGLSLLVINACYGAGFSVIPAILADHYGMGDISKIHGAVLSAWGVAGLFGNQMSIFVSDTLGFGMNGVVVMLIALYVTNLFNVFSLKKLAIIK